MATLPRMHGSKLNKQSNVSISTPFSTSPRKLQEMSPVTLEGHHDITNASGISMKQYEDQLNGLRKENFHLKLRIYFLEEKLGTGSPPAVQGLLEHNVRLQVEVEELRRQLSDKQELLAAAAEAIDVLEQQGSMSADSIDNSLNNSTAMKKDTHSDIQQNVEKTELIDDTCGESEATVDNLAVTSNNEETDELMKLRRENRKALQMIKGCMKKIQQQDKEIKKQKLDKELVYAHVSDSQLEKYEEILKCKDKHIKDLETKNRDLQKLVDDGQNDDDTGNLQQLLTRRLQGLAYFLDKLLAHKCVLGEDKQKLAESILEQSLALPVGLKLDESMAPGELSVDDSTVDMSRSLRLEDITLLFGHHARRDTDSEAWSEPDRRVSQARVGLPRAEPRREPDRAAQLQRELDRLRDERRQLHAAHAAAELALRRAADEAALAASAAALERSRALADLARATAELDDARARLAALHDDKAALELQVALLAAAPAPAPAVAAPPSDDDRPTSPDQGIDSDRLSSLELNDDVRLSPRSLYEENVVLKQKLARTKATLAETLTQLNAANLRKRSVQRAICREIHKTQGVLRKARDQFENQS